MWICSTGRYPGRVNDAGSRPCTKDSWTKCRRCDEARDERKNESLYAENLMDNIFGFDRFWTFQDALKTIEVEYQITNKLAKQNSKYEIQSYKFRKVVLNLYEW